MERDPGLADGPQPEPTEKEDRESRQPEPKLDPKGERERHSSEDLGDREQ